MTPPPIPPNKPVEIQTDAGRYIRTGFKIWIGLVGCLLTLIVIGIIALLAIFGTAAHVIHTLPKH